MSHQVLARKWRPRTFDALVGQDHVVRALDHALKTERLHHAYLFTGTRGVGKTTIARILAKAVNCELGMSPTPCGQCGACTEIDQGRFVDYLELDAASNRGVDEMAQLLDNAVYAPTSGRYKVYVIDEVHMLTAHAFNAMLKTLEEPPAHVLFILATTDPQKVPVTVLSRCMQFNLRNMRPEAIAGHLQVVLDAEQVVYEPAALPLIGRAAAGSMRDALSLLDQAIAYGAGSVKQAQVGEMLGTIDADHLQRVFAALATNDRPALVTIADEVADQNAGADSLLAELAQAVADLSVAGTGGPDALMTQWQDSFSPADLQVFYQILIYSRRDLPLAPDVRCGLTMALLRLVAFKIDDTGEASGSQTGFADSQAPNPVTVRGQVGTPSSLTAPPSGRSRAPDVAKEPPVSTTPVSTTDAPKARLIANSDPAPNSTPVAVRAQPAGSEPAGRPTPAAPRLSGAAAARAALAGGAGLPTKRGPGGAGVQAAQTPDPRRSSALRAALSVTASAPPSAVVTRNTPTQQEPASTEESAIVSAQEADERWDEEAAAMVESAPSEPLNKPTEQRPERAPERGAAASGAVQSNSDEFRPEDPASLGHSASAGNDPLGVAQDRSELASSVSAIAQFNGNWPALASAMALTGRLGQFMQQSQLLNCTGGELHLLVPIKPLADESVVARAQAALSDWFGQAIKLQVQVGVVEGDTAFRRDQATQAARLAAARETIEADPFVNTLLSEFDGQIVPDSIQVVEDSQNKGEEHA